MKWSDIPRFPNILYHMDTPWQYLLETLARFQSDYGLNLDPDFQRGHVWTEAQQIAYVEFMLREPQSGREIYFNHPNWMGDWEGEFVLVDGRQRLEAARRFLVNEIPAFGCLLKDFEGLNLTSTRKIRMPSNICFGFNVAKLKTRADVLQWYIDFNAGGTPHSEKEIERVQGLLALEKSK